MSDQLRTIARTMVGGGRGILAADESITTMNKRLEKVGVEPSAENRLAYREMLITTPGLSQWISGVILSDDVFRGTLSDGRGFALATREVGLLPGIKVDTGAKPLANAPGETITEGLDNLRSRMEEYASMGAAFTKWRAVINIGDGQPTRRATAANAHAMARYAALAQEAGLVPIVEPEVLMDGDHSIERCAGVTETVLNTFFDQLAEQGILLEGIVLKPNMVISAKGAPRQAGVEEVAAATVTILRRTVPSAVPGIAFLSGGQGEELATAHLAAMNRLGPLPWELSFSFGRALVDPALNAWRGDSAQSSAGQSALAGRASANAMARAA
ncbi:MAG TPA: class I fructose-bisphosphate aldolase [Candidatus Dormibacteraeota bacterium]